MTAPVLKPIDAPLRSGTGATYGTATFGSATFSSTGAQFKDLFYRVLMGSLPPGAFNDNDDGIMAIVLRALSAGLGKALELVYQLARELFPRTTDECLTDWERLYALVPAAGASLDDRRQALLAALRGGKGVDIASFAEQLNPVLGEGTFLLYENVAAYVADQPEMVFFAFVWREPGLPGTYDIEAAQRIADRAKEAHLLITVGESNRFLSNDVYSRTNRDILGA